ncbi:hypothetical protein GCM10027346_24130 [Hymenobacter seoulensis]
MSKSSNSQKAENHEGSSETVNEVTQETNPHCGITMPISTADEYSSTYWEILREIISEAIRAADHEPHIVSDGNNSSIIHNRIVTNIYQDDIAICDVSNINPNVILEFRLKSESKFHLLL